MSNVLFKIASDRNEPKVSFGEPKFTKYEYVDKKDGRKKTVVRCEIESYIRTPNSGLYCVYPSGEGIMWKSNMPFPIPGFKIKTVGKAICDERDTFNYDLGRRVARVRAEKKAFQRHLKLARKCMKKAMEFYSTSLERFEARSNKAIEDPIVW